MQSSHQNLEAEAGVLQSKGNDEFKQGNFKDAIKYYTNALIVSSNALEKSIILSNRAAARLKLRQFAEALEDCNLALKYDTKSVKASFRKAVALEGHGEIASALATAREALLLEPSNTSLFDLTARLSSLTSGNILPQTNKPAFSRIMLPKLFATAPFQVVPSIDGIEENLLLLLHGLGDKPGPFASLAKTFSLPQTAYIALGAPHEVPLSDGGRSWFTVFDPTTFELISGRQGEERRIRSMHSTVDALEQLISNLNVYCGWGSRKMHVFGFSQGGTVAMELTRRCAAQGKNLGSCVAIASGLLEEQLCDDSGENNNGRNTNKDTISVPVLLLHGDKDTVVSKERVKATEALLKSNGMEIELHTIPGKWHSMLASEAEAKVLMEFWAKHLSNRPVEDGGEAGGDEASSSLLEIAPGVASISLA